MKFSPPAYWLGILMLATTASVLQADDLSSILPEQAEVEELATGFKFTEGPAWHPEGFLLFSDIPNARVIKREGDGKLTDFYTPSGRVNGIMCDQQGNVYCCQMGEGHVLKLNAEGELQGMLVDTFEGKRMNGPNDLAIDEHGGMYFTDPYYGFLDKERLHLGDANYTEHRSALGFAGVYRVPAPYTIGSADMAAPHLVIDDLMRPNGIAVEPGEDTNALWVSECCQGHAPSCPAATARWYRYTEQPGGLFTHETYVRDRVIEWKPPARGVGGGGCADGFKLLDRSSVGKSLLLVGACPMGVCVVDTARDDNHVIEYVPFPSRVSNVAFGGDGWLYVTGQEHLWRLQLTAEAHGWATKQKEQYAADVAAHGDPRAKSEL